VKNLTFILATIAVTWLAMKFWDAPADLFFRDKKTRVASLPTADSYMTNTTTVKYDLDGNPAYLLTAATGLYYAEDDHFELEAPRLTARKATSGTQPWLLTAAIARSSNLGQQVVLSGDVHARQQTPAGENAFFTAEISYSPADNSARTTAPVKLVYPGGITTGTGMKADFSREIYHLLADVEGRYHAR